MHEPSDAHRPEERLATGYTGRVFIAMSVGWVGVQVGRQIFPPLLPTIIDDFAITPFQAGIAVTVLWAMHAFNQYPSGRLSDQLSRKTVLVGGLLGLTVGFSLLSVAFSYPQLLLAAAVTGFGSGMYLIAVRTTTADFFIEKRSRAFGLQNSFGAIGAAGAAGVAVLILAVGTWRSAFPFLAAFFVLMVLLLHRWVDAPYVVERVDIGVLETGRRIFESPRIRYVLAAYVLLNFTWHGVIAFLPTFLQAEKELSAAMAGAGFAIVYVVGIAVGPLAGVVADRRAKLPVSAMAILAMVVGLISLLLADTTVAIGASIVLFAVGFWSYMPVILAYMMDTFATDSMGGDFGAVKTIYMSFGSLGPSFVGFLAGVGSYSIAYSSLLACLGLSFLVTLVPWLTTPQGE